MPGLADLVAAQGPLLSGMRVEVGLAPGERVEDVELEDCTGDPRPEWFLLMCV